jgi:hypothetical protein
MSSSPSTPLGRHGHSSFQSILNPEADMMEQQRDRRRSASQMETPSPIDTPNSQSLPSISRPPSVDSTQEDFQPSRAFPPPSRPMASMGRHPRSPKPPRLARTQSLNLLNPPTGTIDAHQSPFLTASTRPSDPMLSHQQSLPTPPAGGRISYFPPVSAHGPQAMVRTEVRRPSVGFPQSGSASPIAQYSPYSQPASVASSQYDTSSTQGHYMNRHPSVQMHESRSSAGPMEGERNMIPMAPSGQSSIQLMTIKSQQGHNVQIPVDVQAASKVADEKRRRNAGASARFRARRKEKEREASMSISRLEQQLQNAEQDARFYREERDRYRELYLQQRPDIPGKQSPRLSRPALPPSIPASSTRGNSEDSYADYEEEVREEERNVRRRTSNYHPVSGPPPNDINGPGLVSQASNFAPTNPVSHGQPFLHHEQAHPSTQQPMVSPRQFYHDSFASSTSRYEHRT